jgi:hypothetical protein
MKKYLFLLLVVCMSTPLMAADTYDTSKSTLTIPLVKVGNTYYSDVEILLGRVVSVGQLTSGALPYDTYDSATNQLTIPEVKSGTNTYYNVVVTVGKVLKTGSSCTSVEACTSTTSSLYYGPNTFATAIQASYSAGTMVAATSLTTRGRYLLSNAATQTTAASYLQIGSTYSASTGYGIETASILSGSTYNTYLQKLIQVVSDSSGHYRLDSHLHPNNSIDVDTSDANTLKFRNNFGKATTLYGYVTFAWNSNTRLLQAKKRYKYAYTTTTNTNGTKSYAGSFTEDTSFSAANYYVSLSSGSYKLVAATAAATPFYFYNSPIDLGIPDFMNPQNVAYVTNSTAPFLTKTTVAATEGTSGSIYRSVNATYRSQVLTPGSNATTKTNADAMLASIKTTVEASGETLRYATALYTSFRDAALKNTLASDSIVDGTPGQNMVPYVYFTNEKDTSGKYHPMMVIVSYGNQASPNGLRDVPRPPGSGTGGYAESSVTRSSNLENYVTAIPMKNYGQVSNVTENTLAKTLWSDVAGTTASKNVYTYADTADNGMLVNGAVMFPLYNNNLIPSPMAGELSALGCHVGQGGGGPHCHADGYQASSGLGIYNDSDYVGKTHPPLIGFGYDGLALFGRYRTSDTTMLGYSTALDDFGGHDHDGIGYHYHAHTVTNHKPELLNFTSTVHVLMKGAYIGKTGSIPFFRTNSNFTNNKYLGGSAQ